MKLIHILLHFKNNCPKLAFLLLLFIASTVFFRTEAQSTRQDIAILGFARIEFGVPSNHYYTNFSAGINLGFHREVISKQNFNIDISFQPGIILYQKGMGTSNLEYIDSDQKNKIEEKIIRQSASSQIDIINALSLTLGGTKKQNDIRLENKTFHYFYRSALVQQYNSSLTLGTNFITNFNGRNQQIGFARISLWKAVIAYYNDGTPYQYLLTGDGRDRWWTGGGFLQYGNDRIGKPDSLNSNDSRFSFAAGFDRFTGYSHGMFELGNALKQSFVLHKDPRQYFLNSGRIYIVANDLKYDYALSLSANNIPWLDVQNLIHNSGSMSKHYSLQKESYSFGLIGFYPLKN